jgi:hypothetical protein
VRQAERWHWTTRRKKALIKTPLIKTTPCLIKLGHHGWSTWIYLSVQLVARWASAPNSSSQYPNGPVDASRSTHHRWILWIVRGIRYDDEPTTSDIPLQLATCHCALHLYTRWTALVLIGSSRHWRICLSM